MKKYIIIFITLIVAKPINELSAHTVAKNIYNEFNTKTELNKFDLKNIEIIKEKNTDLLYIYHLNPSGFI